VVLKTKQLSFIKRIC